MTDRLSESLFETDMFGRTPDVVACEAGHDSLAAKLRRAQGRGPSACTSFSPSKRVMDSWAKSYHHNGGFGRTNKAMLRSLLDGGSKRDGEACKAGLAHLCSATAARVPRISLAQAENPNVFLRHFYSLNRPVLISTAGSSALPICVWSWLVSL